MSNKFFIEDLAAYPTVRSRIDKFIKHNNFYTPYFTNELEVICSNICSKFDILISEIVEEIDIEEGLARAYFTADKLIYPRISRSLKNGNPFKTYLLHSKSIEDNVLCLSTFSKAYSSKNSDLIDKIEKIHELLPASSKNYIANKMKEVPADVKILKISNSFQERAAANVLIKSPSLHTADKLYRTFINCNDYFDKFTSLYFLYNILIDNDALIEDKAGLEELKTLVAKKSVYPLESVLSESLYNTDSLDRLIKITPQIICEDYILDIAERVTSKYVYYLFNLTNNEKIIKKLNSIVAKNTEISCKGFIMKFEDMSEDLKESIVEENKRQFFNTYSKWDIALRESKEA